MESVIARSVSDEAIHSFLCVATWIASRSLSSGAHSRDPVARNDGVEALPAGPSSNGDVKSAVFEDIDND